MYAVIITNGAKVNCLKLNIDSSNSPVSIFGLLIIIKAKISKKRFITIPAYFFLLKNILIVFNIFCYNLLAYYCEACLLNCRLIVFLPIYFPFTISIAFSKGSSLPFLMPSIVGFISLSILTPMRCMQVPSG